MKDKPIELSLFGGRLQFIDNDIHLMVETSARKEGFYACMSPAYLTIMLDKEKAKTFLKEVLDILNKE